MFPGTWAQRTSSRPGLYAEPFTYHGDADKTASTRHPAHPFWATVGDLGYVDEEGCLVLTDRKAFMQPAVPSQDLAAEVTA